MAQKAMTARTMLVHAGLSNAANWPAAHSINVGTTPGLGTIDGALSTDPRIKKLFNRVVRTIMLATNSTVRRSDLNFVINPETALIMSETQEIIDVVKQSPDAKSMLTGTVGWTEYMLPEFLYGIRLVVEDAVVTTTPRGAATQTKQWVMGSGLGYMLSRPGALAAENDGPSYSTVTLMVKEDMKVERLREPQHRRSNNNVVDDVGFANTAPIAGMRCINLHA
jgi:hypothetical protein